MENLKSPRLDNLCMVAQTFWRFFPSFFHALGTHQVGWDAKVDAPDVESSTLSPEIAEAAMHAPNPA